MRQTLIKDREPPNRFTVTAYCPLIGYPLIIKSNFPLSKILDEVVLELRLFRYSSRSSSLSKRTQFQFLSKPPLRSNLTSPFIRCSRTTTIWGAVLRHTPIVTLKECKTQTAKAFVQTDFSSMRRKIIRLLLKVKYRMGRRPRREEFQIVSWMLCKVKSRLMV